MLKRILSVQKYMIARMWRCSKMLFFTTFLSAVVAGLAPTLTVYLSRQFVQSLTDLDFPMSLKYIAAIIGAQLAILIFNRVIDTSTMSVYSRIKVNMWFETFEKTCTLDMAIYDSPDVRTLYQEARGATQSNRCNIVLDSAFSLFSKFLTIFSLIAVLSSVEAYIIVIVLIIAAIRISTTVVSKLRLYRTWKEDARTNKESVYCMGLLFDHGYASEMRINNAYPWVIRKYKAVCEKKEKMWRGATIANGFYGFFDGLMNNIEEAVLYIYLAWQMVFGGMTYADFTMFFSAIRTFSSSVTDIISTVMEIGDNAIYIESFKKYMELENVIAVEDGSKTRLPGIVGMSAMDIRNLSFSYPGSDYMVLRDVNLHLELNKFYVIVGANGAGKSTFANLLCRLYDPISGSIALDGNDIRDYYYKDYRALFSCVFQDYKIYDYSVAENVAMDDYKAGDEENAEKIRDCLEKAGVYEKIESLPKGVNTCLGKSFDEDGVYLSGGELQKVALAKALYRNTPIFILDEPSSALDAFAEDQLLSAFRKAAQGRTVFYISHRLSAAKYADKVIFIDGNTVSGFDSHDALMKSNSRYAEMYEVQAKHYK